MRTRSQARASERAHTHAHARTRARAHAHTHTHTDQGVGVEEDGGAVPRQVPRVQLRVRRPQLLRVSHFTLYLTYITADMTTSLQLRVRRPQLALLPLYLTSILLLI